MSLTEGILLGFLQGVAEFLPISSSGHLALAHSIFGTREGSLAFDVLLHLATLCAVCIVYYKDIWKLIKGFFSLIAKLFGGRIKDGLDYGEKLFVAVAIASVPLVPAALLEDKIENASNTIWLVGMLLIINGVMLFISDRLAKGTTKIAEIGYKNPLYIGIVQMFAVLPGISRSGSTITAGMICGLKRSEAVKFSFLMSVPAILGACVLKLPQFFKSGIPQADVLPIMSGAITALIVGFGAICLLRYISRKGRFGWFGAYSVLIGITAVIYGILK